MQCGQRKCRSMVVSFVSLLMCIVIEGSVLGRLGFEGNTQMFFVFYREDSNKTQHKRLLGSFFSAHRSRKKDRTIARAASCRCFLELRYLEKV